jgi:hypothetical protein
VCRCRLYNVCDRANLARWLWNLPPYGILISLGKRVVTLLIGWTALRLLYVYLTTLSVTGTVTSNEWMAVGSELESTCKCLRLAARFCPCHFLERLGKTQNPLICGSRCRGRVLNQVELEFKKVRISLIMPCRHIGGVEEQVYPFVTSTIDGGE